LQHLPVFERDSVVTHAGGDGVSGAEAVPLPEPEPQPPQIDVNWLNTVVNTLVDNTVKAPYIAYSNALKTRPLLTKACTSLVGFVLGDLIAQVSSSRAGCVPACVTAPIPTAAQ
jgi:hypothetical protein